MCDTSEYIKEKYKGSVSLRYCCSNHSANAGLVEILLPQQINDKNRIKFEKKGP